ncbi:hypothetical protein ABT112_27030 [Streptomyces sp. NPDC002055]|uniref:hypothetical protein n=1 Tax=Streptomyces sp. NPDC002055 TaxID=3154534 RepID=UPI003324204D
MGKQSPSHRNLEADVHLDITPALIRELARSRRQAETTGILLGPHGWQVETWAGSGSDSALVALTAEGLDAYLDGTELEEDDIAALATPDDGPPSYRIPAEDGGLEEPAPDATWQVITSTATDLHCGEYKADWRSARWFDVDAATCLVRDDERDAYGRSTSLWRTAGGRYVLRLRSLQVEELPLEWAEMPLDQAVPYVYDAARHRVAEDLPPALQAARHAADLVALLAAPDPAPDNSPEVYRARVRRALGASTEVVHATKAVSELLRGRVLTDLRAERSHAAQLVASAFGDRDAAAQHLRMSYPALSHLL